MLKYLKGYLEIQSFIGWVVAEAEKFLFTDVEIEEVGINISVNEINDIHNSKVPDKFIPLIVIEVSECF